MTYSEEFLRSIYRLGWTDGTTAHAAPCPVPIADDADRMYHRGWLDGQRSLTEALDALLVVVSEE